MACLLTEVVLGQRYLLLTQVGKRYAVRFYEGEKIRFKIKGEKFFHEATILGVKKEGYLRFHYFNLSLDEIASIDIRHKDLGSFNLRQYGSMLPVAGGGYFLLDVLRNGNVEKSTILVSGSFIGVGFLLRAIRKKQFKPGGKRKMNIVDI